MRKEELKALLTGASDVDCPMDGNTFGFCVPPDLGFIKALIELAGYHKTTVAEVWEYRSNYWPLRFQWEPRYPLAPLASLHINAGAGHLPSLQVLEVLGTASSWQLDEVYLSRTDWEVEHLLSSPNEVAGRYLLLGLRDKRNGGPRTYGDSYYAGRRGGVCQHVLYRKDVERLARGQAPGPRRTRQEVRQKWSKDKRVTALAFFRGTFLNRAKYRDLLELGREPIDGRTAQGRRIQAAGGWLQKAWQGMDPALKQRMRRHHLVPARSVIDSIDARMAKWLPGASQVDAVMAANHCHKAPAFPFKISPREWRSLKPASLRRRRPGKDTVPMPDVEHLGVASVVVEEGIVKDTAVQGIAADRVGLKTNGVFSGLKALSRLALSSFLCNVRWYSYCLDGRKGSTRSSRVLSPAQGFG